MEEICIRPVGVVRMPVEDIYSMPIGGERAIVEVKEEFVPALQRIEENSHIWVICWFDGGERNVLQTMPHIIEPEPVKFGVFAVRCYKRPNPIAITLVSLERVEGNLLYISGMDAVEGTPVLDIKSYCEQDSIFFPRTAYIKPKEDEMRRSMMYKLAYQHHRKFSAALEIGVRICLTTETYFGQLLNPDLSVSVKGSRELADVIQGITRAKLANPPRFTFCEYDLDSVVFTKGGKTLTFRVFKRFSEEELAGLGDDKLFLMTKGFVVPEKEVR